MPSPKQMWWSSIPNFLENASGPTKMLLPTALDRGQTVLTGNARGFLENDEPSGFNKFLDKLGEVTKGALAVNGGPFFDRGAMNTMLVWDSGAMTVDQAPDGKVSVEVACLDEKLYLALSQAIVEMVTPDYVRQPIYALSVFKGQPSLEEVGSAGIEFDPRNYTADAVEGYNFIVENLSNEKPYGRLSIIEGAPGTGKTYLLRGILQEVLDAVFILVSSDTVESLAGPNMLPVLLKARGLAGPGKPLVLVIEDADRCLKAREEGQETAAISALLNLSDGILGQTLDLRILTTTNLSEDQIDPALKRPGRLSKHVMVGPLPKEQAEEVYTHLFGPNNVAFDGPHTLAQIYAEAYNEKRNQDIAEEVDSSEEDDEEFDEEEDDEDEDDDEDAEDEDELVVKESVIEALNCSFRFGASCVVEVSEVPTKRAGRPPARVMGVRDQLRLLDFRPRRSRWTTKKLRTWTSSRIRQPSSRGLSPRTTSRVRSPRSLLSTKRDKGMF